MSGMDWIEGGLPNPATGGLITGERIAVQVEHCQGVHYGIYHEGDDSDSGPMILVYSPAPESLGDPRGGLVSRWRLATDLDRFLELYRSFGVELEAKSFSDEASMANDSHYTPHHPDAGYVVVLRDPFYEPTGLPGKDRFCGYSGFYGDAVFDLDGRFVEQGFWE